ncbi:hypothetical protein CKF54_03685 [Psittacicella hinzii]|uniref:Uncharacterized protein n=1 Tax=Psittacicella hinzii TaxID=2028575 RepID=A0A3A1Y3U2_9GAMM|nr:hypothetical protein [Psittacicella hinzii]RIY32913.1 hypothetical protein CKF54_03685 [Psittacicella hinzii]
MKMKMKNYDLTVLERSVICYEAEKAEETLREWDDNFTDFDILFRKVLTAETKEEYSQNLNCIKEKFDKQEFSKAEIFISHSKEIASKHKSTGLVFGALLELENVVSDLNMLFKIDERIKKILANLEEEGKGNDEFVNKLKLVREATRTVRTAHEDTPEYKLLEDLKVIKCALSQFAHLVNVIIWHGQIDSSEINRLNIMLTNISKV